MSGFFLTNTLASSLMATLVATGAILSPTMAVAEEVIGSTDFVTPDAPGTHIMTFIIQAAAGEEIKMHSHGGTGMVLMLEGEVAVTDLNASAKTYSAGETFMEPVGNVHSAVISNAGPARILWTIVLPDGKELESPYTR